MIRKAWAILQAAALMLTAGATAEKKETKTLRILATSDLHGKMVPWDYILNGESPVGSMAQLATAVAKYRTAETLLVDAGDTIQDNRAELFVGTEGTHPMVQALNAIGYDIWVTGNHEYNFGMNEVRKTIADVRAKVLTGNVRDETGKPIADGWTIRKLNGIRVAVIGMVTHNIARMDTMKLKDCTITDPLTETRKILDEIRGRYDVLLGVFHLGINNEFGVPNSGVTDILNACPEFDVMIASHDHKLIPSLEINGVLVTENKAYAQSMAVIDLELEQDGNGWKVRSKQAQSVDVGAFEPDPAMMALMAPYDSAAREDAKKVIARLEGGPMVPPDRPGELPEIWTRDTALADLIQQVQMHFTGAPVSAALPPLPGTSLSPGDIHQYDLPKIYRYQNTLCRLRMNGKQLKKYMEWAVSIFNTRKEGEPVTVNPEIPSYNYDQFEGVCYEVDISREPGNRIRNLTWPDGTPVEDTEEFDVAVNSYRANTQLLMPGVIFEENELPLLMEADVRGEDIGDIREMIRVYITAVKGGVLTPDCSGNWKLTGIE